MYVLGPDKQENITVSSNLLLPTVNSKLTLLIFKSNLAWLLTYNQNAHLLSGVPLFKS